MEGAQILEYTPQSETGWYGPEYTKDKIDPDYFTCNVIECRYISTVGKD